MTGPAKKGTLNTRWGANHHHESKKEKDEKHPHFGCTVWNSTIAALPKWSANCTKALLGITVALYVLNQGHFLPRPLSAIVSKVLFWPSLPITLINRVNRRGKWTTMIDDTVLMGGAPFGFAGVPDSLHQQYNVRGVINMCEEYQGPSKAYEKLGMKELWLPTTDHFEPAVGDLRRAVNFIRSYQAQGKRVYVHCRAGHGRSAAVVLAWLLSKDPTVDRQRLNQELCQKRNVRSTLWKQDNIVEFHSQLLHERKDDEDEDDEKS